MGPRFLFEWFLEFASGEFFPLSILSPLFFYILAGLPFAFLLYYPLIVYLGKLSLHKTALVILAQVFWIAVFSLAALVVWKKGLKKYSGEGI